MLTVGALNLRCSIFASKSITRKMYFLFLRRFQENLSWTILMLRPFDEDRSFSVKLKLSLARRPSPPRYAAARRGSETDLDSTLVEEYLALTGHSCRFKSKQKSGNGFCTVGSLFTVPIEVVPNRT